MSSSISTMGLSSAVGVAQANRNPVTGLNQAKADFSSSGFSQSQFNHALMAAPRARFIRENNPRDISPAGAHTINMSINRLVRQCLLILGAMTLSCAAIGKNTSFAFRAISPTSLELSENGKPVLVYNFGGILAAGAPEATRRSTYLHPVYAPDGTGLTDDFNRDHPHHRGIFWAWESVTFDGQTDDIWTVKGFRQQFVRWMARETNGPVARLAVENGWFAGERKFVKEEVEILIHPTAKNRRQLDFTLSFEATEKPVIIAGAPGRRKGYGGFAFRTAPRDGGIKKTRIHTDKGICEKNGVMARHSWAEIRGTFQGKKEAIRIEDDRSNPGYPNNGWLLRHAFALLNVSYPGLELFTLLPGQPLVLKYRVTLSSGKAAK